jgi:hypothetical protein
MATEWFCKVKGEQFGPMPFEELVAMAHWGCFARDAFVQEGSDGAWLEPAIVPGLLARGPKPFSVASKPAAEGRTANRQSGSPARRSVHNDMETQYWFRTGKKIAGPFSARQLRQLAEHGLLSPNTLISRDQRSWTSAACLKGLAFHSEKQQSETRSLRSAVEFDSPLEWSDSLTMASAR